MSSLTGQWKQTVESLYFEHSTALHRKATAALWDRNKAPDLVQEVFEKMLRAERTFPSKVDAEKYMYTAFRHLLIDYIRKDTRWRFDELDEANPAGLSRKAHQEEDLVKERLDAEAIPLPNPEKSVFIMAYFDKMTDQEIAEKLNQDLNTIRYCLVKSRKGLEKILVQKYGYSKETVKAFFSRKKG